MLEDGDNDYDDDDNDFHCVIDFLSLYGFVKFGEHLKAEKWTLKISYATHIEILTSSINSRTSLETNCFLMTNVKMQRILDYCISCCKCRHFA